TCCRSIPEVRKTRQEEAPQHVENTDHEHECAGEGWRNDAWQCGTEDFREHRLSDSEHANAGGDVEAENDPQQVKLRRPYGLLNADGVGGDHLSGRILMA